MKSKKEIREKIKFCEEQYKKTLPWKSDLVFYALWEGKILALKWVLEENQVEDSSS